MRSTRRLPIYQAAHKLVSHLHQTTRKAPRDLRYSLVQRTLDQAVELCVDIADANRATGTERADHIETAHPAKPGCSPLPTAPTSLVGSSNRTAHIYAAEQRAKPPTRSAPPTKKPWSPQSIATSDSHGRPTVGDCGAHGAKKPNLGG